MFYVYILRSEKDKKRYIGFTKNLDRRLIEHNSGLVKSTKNRRPLTLIYVEEYSSKTEAMNREKEIKGNLLFLIEGLQPLNIYFGANPTAASNSTIFSITDF